MISSMTGYGRGEASADGIRITAEVRTLNNRYFDFGLRAPRTVVNFEYELRELCRRRIQRGKLSLVLSETRSAQAPASTHIDVVSARRLAHDLSTLSAELGLHGGVTLDHLLHFPELVVPADDTTVGDLLLGLCRESTDAALSDLKTMREAEGRNLARDMSERLAQIEQSLTEVARLQGDVPARALDKLRERIKRLVQGPAYDEYRLEMELALLSDRLDITEECVRLQGHLRAFADTIVAAEGAAGKRLEFLLQEMHRESNTICSKTSLLEISHLGVKMREEIERLREQVQNIE